MRDSLLRVTIGFGLVLLPLTALGAQTEAAQILFSKLVLGGFALFALAVIVIGCFKPIPQNNDSVALRTVLNGADAKNLVPPDALVMDCITIMNDQGHDSLLVMDGEKLVGIFTDRDALRNVLLPGRDPRRTRICEVMTLDPCCVSPMTTVGAAMRLVNERQFKHLPVVDNGRVQAVVLRRDLRRWLDRSRVGRAREPLKRCA